MKVIFSTPLEDARWPWPQMNVNEVAERALGNEIFMPNIGYIDIGNVQKWSADLEGAANSKKLWINSLVTPHACLVESKGEVNNQYFKKSVELIDAYLKQYESDEGLFDIAWKDEHAVSNRLFVLCAFIRQLVHIEDASISQLELLYHAERHARWLSHDKHYVKNNHGVMMDLSLAQYSVLIREIDSTHASFYLKVALNRLGMMLEDTFDSEGCCTENSPTYHFVNYSLFLSIFSFLKKYAKDFNLDGWEETLERAKVVGALLLRPDGTMPLIGDSESRPGTFFPDVRPELSNGVGYYPKAGLLVLSDDNVHFTFRAGGSKYSHRHIDDLSITFWTHGKDFIVDSGLYNYDISDKLRRRFISSDSHSGFYLRSQGHVLFKNFDTPEDMSRFRSFESVSVDKFDVIATQSLSKAADVTRSISYSSGVFLVQDSFEAESEQEWRCQFILHPEVHASINHEEQKVFLSRGDVQVFLDFQAEGEALIALENSFYSPRFMEVLETKCLVVKGKSCSTRLLSTLSFI